MSTALLTTHQLAVLRTHLDPRGGSAYWLDRAGRLGVRDTDELKTVNDLSRLGDMSAADLRERPLWDYIPRRYHDQPQRLVIGQTGGATGSPTWTAYMDDEFDAAFVRPFVDAAEHVGFPRGLSWLFVGPSGPHIIGQAARAIARAVGSAEPFSVDFDPRWARKLAQGSVAAGRYLQHVVDQAMQVIESQPVRVLFATPPVLTALAERMTPDQRRRIRGVHYGGMAIGEDTLRQLQCQAFPEAIHLSGYGNTLLGCCLELNTEPGRTPTYYPRGERLIFETIDGERRPTPFGTPGCLRVSRLDQTVLIVRLTERDTATLVTPPHDAPPGFTMPGVRDPQPIAQPKTEAPVGLY